MSDQENLEIVNKNKKHRKEKPWDTPEIDKWQVTEFKKGEMSHSLLEESSFSILFPKYKEAYLKEYWSIITSTLKQHGIGCELDLVKGSMTVMTTKETFDPYIIFKARDLIKLLARSVPFQQAKKVLQDDTNCDIIKIGNLVRNKERFVKRRQRLLGPNGNTLKAIELLTQCYVIITDCMNNIHPIYHIKTLMIKRELAKDEKLKNENWDRFLPQFKKQNIKSKKIVKKQRQVFPPEQLPRKVDLQIQSGEFFLSQKDKHKKDLDSKKEVQQEKVAAKQIEKQKQFIPPTVKTVEGKEVAKEVSVEELKLKFKEKGKKRKADMDSNQFVQKPVLKKTK